MGLCTFWMDPGVAWSLRRVVRVEKGKCCAFLLILGSMSVLRRGKCCAFVYQFGSPFANRFGSLEILFGDLERCWNIFVATCLTFSMIFSTLVAWRCTFEGLTFAA